MKKTAIYGLLIASALVVMALELTWHYHGWQGWIARETGSQNNSSTPPNYNYNSGFGSVFPYSWGILVSLILVTYHSFKRHNCHVHRCWRIGRHPMVNGQYVLCSRHHREGTNRPNHMTLAHILHAHEEATKKGTSS